MLDLDKGEVLAVANNNVPQEIVRETLEKASMLGSTVIKDPVSGDCRNVIVHLLITFQMQQALLQAA